MAQDRDILADAIEAYKAAQDAEGGNRAAAIEDLRFGRLGEQWDAAALEKRRRDGRPALTINKMQPFIRQVVNDARQNKPRIRVRPVDSGADPATAHLISDLIRNIESASNADVAYDTASEFAVSCGFGYFRIDVAYAHDDTFDKDLRIERIANPFSVFGDPNSRAADSSDWNSAFVTELMTRRDFEQRFKGAEAVDWDGGAYSRLPKGWTGEDGEVLVAEWWTREEAESRVLLLSDGKVMRADAFAAARDWLEAQGVGVVRERPVRTHRVRQRVLSGAEVLETSDWAGRYIPIVPVYGDEVNIEGERHFRSLIRDAKDAQRMFNFWRTTTTELVGDAPRTPFIGKRGAFDADPRWATANTEAHAYLEYDGDVPPQRQPFAGVPAGALQEALNASDDMKAIIGLYDASLGARSNETSGRAILYRQREGDVATYHFVDNLSRAIRHAGRILIDLIPSVYTPGRVLRTVGQDGTLGAARVVEEGKQADPAAGIYDLAAGKYDLVVDTGPSFTTRRQETAEQMMQLLQAFPAAAPVVGDIMARNLDWPGAEEIAERLKAINPALTGGGVETQRLAMENQKAQAELASLRAELDRLKAGEASAIAKAQLDREKLGVEREKLAVARFEAETERMKLTAAALPPPPIIGT